MKNLGFGTMRLPLLDPSDPTSIDQEQVNKMADLFLERGFTYVDTAYMYHNHHSEGAVRKAFTERYPRDRFVLADKMPISFVKTAEDYPRFFAEQLERTGAGYFDYYLLHNINGKSLPIVEETGGFDYLFKLRDEGKIRHAGFSFHDTPELLESVLSKYPGVEFVQLQLNYVDWDSEVVQARKNYEVCVKYGKKVVVMEPVKGGALANVPAEVTELFRGIAPEASNASWAVRFAASQPAVFMVLSGMSSFEQMEDNSAYMIDFKPLDETEKAAVDKAVGIIRDKIAIPCTSCRYCVNHEPGCPVNMAIPEYFGIYNSVCQFGQSWSSTQKYRNLRNSGHAAPSECLACGQCESHCPQHIGIIEQLQKLSSMEELMTGTSFKL